MLNRSEILRTAWARYHEQIAFAGSNCPFSRKLFAAHLRGAWADAKAIEFDRQRAAAIAAKPARAREIEAELLDLELADRMNWSRHTELTAELGRIAA